MIAQYKTEMFIPRQQIKANPLHYFFARGKKEKRLKMTGGKSKTTTLSLVLPLLERSHHSYLSDRSRGLYHMTVRGAPLSLFAPDMI